MTGFGRAEIKSKQGQTIIEISSVNNRFLEMSVRLPRPYLSMEPSVRKLVSEKLGRGKIYLTVTLQESPDNLDRYTINEVAARAYIKQLKGLADKHKVPFDIDLSHLLALPNVIESNGDELDLETIWPALSKGIERATAQLVKMRAAEGKAMAADMKVRLSRILDITAEIEQKTANATKLYAERLNERIGELLQAPLSDSSRLEEEIALFADRTDISEEIVRLQSHTRQFRDTLKASDAVGRRLNFILQEMNREVNTIGSKSADFGIASDVISLKEEVEKLREMVQNVE